MMYIKKKNVLFIATPPMLLIFVMIGFGYGKEKVGFVQVDNQ